MSMKIAYEKTLLPIFSLLPVGALAQVASDSTIYKNVKLDTVVVTGKRPLVTHYGTKDIVNVKGSYLSGLGDLGSLLAATPGIVAVGQKEYRVVGKGAPKYYIDGREVTQQDIFSTVKSGNVARIEIEREPSAKYPSGTNAVVNIVTIKPITDLVSLNIYNTVSLRRKMSDDPSFDFTYSRGKWASSISYGYGTSGNLNKETYFVEIFHPDYTFRSDEYNRAYSRDISHNVTWSNDFYINEKHRLGFVYNFKHSDDNATHTEQTTYNDRVSSEVKDIVRKENDRRNLHNVSLSYSGSLTENSSLDLSADYSAINDKTNYLSDETSRTTNSQASVYTRSRGTYDIVTLNGSYSFMLPGDIDSEIGVRYYSTHHPLDYATNNSFVDASAADSRQTMDDNVSAGYFKFQRAWKKFSFSVGGRYEYSDTRIKIRNNAGGYNSSHHTSDFLPSAMLQWYVTPKFVLRGTYSRNVVRQGYRGLNPYPTYKDSLSYATGNADLRPEYSDKYILYGFLGRHVVIGLGYVNRYDGIENVTYCQSADRNVVTEMPLNIHRSEHYQCMLMYSRSFGNFYFSGTAALTLPHDTYYFRDERHRVTKPYWEGDFNLSYTMSEKFSAYTSFSYQSFNCENFTKQRRVDNWSAGVQSNLMKKRLTLSLGVTDILHHANYNNLSERFLNTRNGTYGTNDMRGVSFSLTYRLFNKKLSTEASSGSDDVIERTE